MIYNINDRPPFGKLLLTGAQMLFSIFTATTLIAVICGVDLSGALVGSGVSTIVYLVATKFRSPMYISNSGAFVAPVTIALAAGGTAAVAIGGLTTAIIYCIFGVLFSRIGVEKLYRFMPKVVIGSVTMVIGLTLMTFIPGYIGDSGNIGVIIALITALTIGMISTRCKGVCKLFPFLIGTGVGYIISIPFGLVDFSKFNGIHLFKMPVFAFQSWEDLPWTIAIPIIFLYAAYDLSALCECLSDTAVLSGVTDRDLYQDPGLLRIFNGEGLANIASSFLGGLGACSYGEGIAAIGFSGCGSVWSTFTAAIMIIILGFVEPVQVFISTIPSCVLGGGTALVLYGFIAESGLDLIAKNVDLASPKNKVIIATILSIGVASIGFSFTVANTSVAFAGTALALIVGIIENLVYKDE